MANDAKARSGASREPPHGQQAVPRPLVYRSSKPSVLVRPPWETIGCIRILAIIGCIAALVWSDWVVATAIEPVWLALRQSPVYKSVFFETLQVPVVAAVFYCLFLWLAEPPTGEWRSRFDMRSDNEAKRTGALNKQGRGAGSLGFDVVSYTTPLLLLDCITRKRYPGFTDQEWDEHPYVAWQVPLGRPLPEAPPTVANLLLTPLAAMVVYDFVFYFLHVLFHRIRALRGVHLHHHDHDTVAWGVTNQLTVAERTALVLLANESLKLVRAHPMSRTVFVFLFIGALMESHSNLDLPLGVDKLVPCYGGARAHVTHHTRVHGNFAPFFTWMDRFFGTALPCPTPRCLVGDEGEDPKPGGRHSWFWDTWLALEDRSK